MNKLTSPTRFGALSKTHPLRGHKGVLDARYLPDSEFEGVWSSIFLADGAKEQLLCQGVLNFTARSKLQALALPMHGIILLVGPPGTGKTSVARGLASRIAASLGGNIQYIEVDPHALASASLGKSQQAVSELLGSTIGEAALASPTIVLLDEVETLAGNRAKMSMEANPVDVHRATDAVLTQLDQLAARHSNLLFIATSNFAGAIDSAFVSRADLVLTVGMPTPEACKHIVLDTLDRIAQAYPKTAGLKTQPAITKAAAEAVGLDGRRIRKAVIAALASSQEVAMDPNRLTAEAVLEAIKQAKQQAKGMPS